MTSTRSFSPNSTNYVASWRRDSWANPLLWFVVFLGIVAVISPLPSHIIQGFSNKEELYWHDGICIPKHHSIIPGCILKENGLPGSLLMIHADFYFLSQAPAWTFLSHQKNVSKDPLILHRNFSYPESLMSYLEHFQPDIWGNYTKQYSVQIIQEYLAVNQQGEKITINVPNPNDYTISSVPTCLPNHIVQQQIQKYQKNVRDFKSICNDGKIQSKASSRIII